MLGVLFIIGCPVQLIREDFLRLHFRCRHTFASLWGACLRFVSLWLANSRGDSCFFGVHLSKVCWGLIFCLRIAFIDLCLLNRPKPPSFRSLLLNFTLDYKPSYFQHGSSLSLENVCSWCMHQTGFSSAAVVSQSKSTELCSSAAVVPQSKSTEMWSSAAPFDHDLWYFRHRTNEHFNSMLFIRKTYKPAHSNATLESLKSTRSTKLLEKLLRWATHTFHWRLSQG